ncbi:NAD(P)-binding domain-containing protein [Leucobacter sp. cx-42]|uniref:NAD(P)-binding domain-containing protein n=1 Tax=unclassified Leucobacter TaxID=2621730 RepID=UPI00165E9194|nr:MULTISPECIES: NAD(P)-binding domain-containing protein [unclassified Leucobacter]MBC9953032.1 NAD(P)-binding domain-containing protein [Leucobacter sp. cx-42]
MPHVDVLVIGAGQAGLSAAYHLQRIGFVPESRAQTHERSFAVLDANETPGGAWQHRWESLTMSTVNNIYELPGFPVPPAPPQARSNAVLPAYFAAYEQRFDLDVHRPVRVESVRRGAAGSAPHFIIETSRGDWSATYVINATGTWTRPYVPFYPGAADFAGEQLHVQNYVTAEAFVGRRVVIVGGGISATQLLEEVSRYTDTFWVTRTPPEWVPHFTQQQILASLEEVEERTRAGLPPRSVASVTGMFEAPWVLRAAERGVLNAHPMFTRIEPHGVRMPDGSFEPADVILWATGFHAEIRHLKPLQLRTIEGGIRVGNGRSLDEPHLFVIGYGSSQSTVGANRAGRDAVRAIRAEMNAETGAVEPAALSHSAAPRLPERRR